MRRGEVVNVTYQYVGAILGVLGAFFVAMPYRQARFYAFNMWTVSNVALIVVFVQSHQWPLFAMQMIFLGTSIMGVYNNWPEKPLTAFGKRSTVFTPDMQKAVDAYLALPMTDAEAQRKADDAVREVNDDFYDPSKAADAASAKLDRDIDKIIATGKA